jgi:GNAT superfamily N-acetyltransferase
VLEIRLAADEIEREVSLAIYNEVIPEEAVSMKELREWEAVQIATTDLLAFLDEQPVASASAGIGHARSDQAQTFVTVLPDMRGQGIGSALYAKISEWAQEQGATQLFARIQEREAESIAFAERRGFEVVIRDGRLILDLTGFDPPPVGAPEGLEIVRWIDRPELARGLHEVTFEANPDVPGSEDWTGEPFEVWERMHRPPLMFAAVANDEVVGFAELFVTEARPGTAVHMMTGVKRDWRNRGIAGALKRAQIAWAKAEGYERMETANEERNEPIRRLNRRLGYREAPGRVVVRGPLAASAGP